MSGDVPALEVEGLVKHFPVGSRRRMTQFATVDLPLPDSPTSPSISPGASENETSSTA